MESILCLLLVMCFCLLLCMGCREEERQALLTFKQSLVDGGDEYLSNWKGRNCCNWAGVGCSNTTDGNVIQLSIGSLISEQSLYFFTANSLDHSLSSLKHLQHLDLRYSIFNYTPIPQFIGSFRSLKYLDLSITGFNGRIPPHLGNLTHLQYLNLSNVGLKSDSLQWLSNLSSLKYLGMSGVNLTDAVDWPLVFNKLPALSVLQLSSCSLQFFPHSTSGQHANASSITSLDLSVNSFDNITILVDWLVLNLRNSLVQLDLSLCSFDGPVPHSIGNLSFLTKLSLAINDLHGSLPWSLSQLSALEELDLSMNSLEGILHPEIITNLCNLRILGLNFNHFTGNLFNKAGGRPRCKRYYLEYLDLSNNQLSGSLPYWIGQMENLKTLNLNNNNLNGSLPESLGQLSELVSLDLTINSLQGVVSDAHFANMTKLEALLLNGNHLIFNITSTWLPPFQLKELYLRSCQIGPQFPLWLRTQSRIWNLDISDTGIAEIPSWFWNASSGVQTLNISHNQIRGQTPTSLEFLSASCIDLSWNRFHGNLPYLNSSISFILFNDNMFSGDLQPVLGKTTNSLEIVLLSRNFLTGKIPSAICNSSSLRMIDASDNKLSGEFPNCPSSNLQFLQAINFASNYLTGSIPDWICGVYEGVSVLHLGNNIIYGEIRPSSFRNCSAIKILNLEENKLTGEVPSWIGENLTELQFLNLRSNMFTGKLPPQLSYLASLQVLDLAHNDLQGVIPSSFKNLTAMAETNRTERQILGLTDMEFDGIIPGNFEELLDAVVKGREVKYTNTLSLVMTLDLSSNRLSGDIPIELMDLVSLQSLNLSGNQLKGKIPDKFGGMRQLESLDLSWNQLTGSIPESITLLTSLDYLNLSYNNLSGRIPIGNQLHTLTSTSIYVGNRDLCGFPLPTCPGDEPFEGPLPSSSPEGEVEDSDSDTFCLFLGMGLGYATGLWGICRILLFKISWRIAYFRFFDDMADRLYVAKEILRRRILTAIQG